MGDSGDHSLMPVHAHINLLGFTLIVLFAMVYQGSTDNSGQTASARCALAV
jgi:hypothetical protein